MLLIVGFRPSIYSNRPCLPLPSTRSHRRQQGCRRPATKDDDNQKKKGYQFGDISRFLAKSASNKISQVTGKDKYEFGDLSKWIDQRVKDKVTDWTGKERYEFGDLTRWVDQAAKERVANFTAKSRVSDGGNNDNNNTYNYQFGDISREIVRRVTTGEYSLDDVFLALKVVLAAGASLTPIANVLPIKWLLQLINFGIAEQIADKLLGSLATALDERIKEALTGNAKYQLGDITKRKLSQAINNFTGKESYQFGDISRRVMEIADKDHSENEKSPAERRVIDIDFKEDDGESALKELEEWDRRFQQEAASDPAKQQ